MENIFLTEKQAAEKYQLSTRTFHNWSEVLTEKAKKEKKSN